MEELPESLDETYERILREIRKPNQGHAYRLLQCLVVDIRPLRVEELAEVLASDLNGDASLGLPFRLEECVRRTTSGHFALFRYAAKYWPPNERVENVSSRTKNDMECLFDADKPYFATWLWIYDEDRRGLSMLTEHPEK